MEKKLENLTLFIEKGVIEGYTFTGLEIKIKEIVEVKKEEFKFSFEDKENKPSTLKATIEKPPYQALKKLIKEGKVAVTFKKSEEGLAAIIREVIGFLYYKQSKELFFLTSMVSIDQRSITDQQHESNFTELNGDVEAYIKREFEYLFKENKVKFTHKQNCNLIIK